ncbi:hypothetical protein ACS0TY_033490 [Phlomoides rotata]
MQTTSLQSLRLQPPFSGNFTLPNRRNIRAPIPILAMRRDEKGEKYRRRDHKLVDENMIVLKMRIQEMTMKEEEDRATSPPDHWMGWEKEWYKSYDYDVYELVGLLHNLLMNTRPSFAIGVVVLLMLSVSTPLALVLTYFVNIAM